MNKVINGETIIVANVPPGAKVLKSFNVMGAVKNCAPMLELIAPDNASGDFIMHNIFINSEVSIIPARAE